MENILPKIQEIWVFAKENAVSFADKIMYQDLVFSHLYLDETNLSLDFCIKSGF
jgi:hypothetical protein